MERSFVKLLGLLIVLAIKNCHGCSSPVALVNNSTHFRASSHQKNHPPSNAILGTPGDWCAIVGSSTEKHVLEIRLPTVHQVDSIVIQGSTQGPKGFFFKIHYENDKGNLLPAKPEYRYISFYPEDHATFTLGKETSLVKIQVWGQRNVCLRVQLKGCEVNAKCRELGCKHRLCEKKSWFRSWKCKCRAGYRLNDDGKTCSDINECQKSWSDKCDGQTTKCVNDPGAYHCECLRNTTKLDSASGNKRCVDINECLTNNGGCQQQCVNTKVGHHCKCYHGYREQNGTCVEIDECKEGSSGCNLNTTRCENTIGSSRCVCLGKGFELDSTQKSCKDKDECKIGGTCQQVCTNKIGSYKCSCTKGYKLNPDKHTCSDILECSDKSLNDCEQLCTEGFHGNYLCSCQRGFKIQEDGKSCKDNNECEQNVHGCEFLCVNTIGSYNCTCDKGYRLNKDGRTCDDVNECQEKKDNCGANSLCVNINGGYECRCLTGYKKDANGQCKAKRCQALAFVTNGAYDKAECHQDKGIQYKEQCVVKCNAGYQLTAKSSPTATCRSDGRWNFNGFVPSCEARSCPVLPNLLNGRLYPFRCTTNGVTYGNKCEFVCDNGYDLAANGYSVVTCGQDGQYSPSPHKAKCIKRAKLKCPSNTIRLLTPPGSDRATIPLHLLENVTKAHPHLVSQPEGVLNGTHSFVASLFSHRVQLSTQHESCNFYVQVEDREAPTVKNCPGNSYVVINDVSGEVTWKEPTFSDNVGIAKRLQNLKSGEHRSQQVYYVIYEAADKSGNIASCRFFVNVRAKYCSRDSLPGGENAMKRWMGSGSLSLSVIMRCPPNYQFSSPVTFAMFRCQQGLWLNQNIPDCVPTTPLPVNATTCPDGKMKINALCGACPKGTKGVGGQCVPCARGHYQDQMGQLTCKKCASGFATLLEGQKSSSNCERQCETGEYSEDGVARVAKGCVPCPIGSFQDVRGQNMCKVCKQGTTERNATNVENKCLLSARVSKVVPVDSNLIVPVGSNVTIECHGTGSPQPNVKIEKQRTAQNSASVKTLTSVTTQNQYTAGVVMSIYNIQPEDNGVYYCFADNRHGNNGAKDRRMIFVEVF